MAVSGSKNFVVTRADIIEAALRKIGAYDQGESVDGADTVIASKALNMMVKAWLARGVDLHLRQTLTLFLQPNQESYTFSSTSTDKYTNDTIVETTLSAAEASGQTVISVTSSTGMTANDVVGIKMDDNTIHWSTIASVDTATQITINDATDDDAASGNKVYTYTNTGDTPRDIIVAYRRDTSGLDTQVDTIGEVEYGNISDKDADGPPSQVFYRQGVDSGKLHVWPTDWADSGDKIILVGRVLPDDFDAASNNPDFPVEWSEAIVYNLADRLAPEYGVPIRERQMLKTEAEFYFNEMLGYDDENASVIIAQR